MGDKTSTLRRISSESDSVAKIVSQTLVTIAVPFFAGRYCLLNYADLLLSRAGRIV
jgi:hypothetical protein